MNITYFQVTGAPLRPGDCCYSSGWRNVNFSFNQFVTAVGIYATTNPLWPWITFQYLRYVTS